MELPDKSMATQLQHVPNAWILTNEDALPSDDAAIFDASEQQASHANQLGRGTAFFFAYSGLQLVLRHYRRGGLQRFILRNQYIFTGMKNTRMWQEFHLLQEMYALGLPVPRPIAARCQRTSFFTYTGSLITEAIPNSETLAQRLKRTTLPAPHWRALGSLIARFHKLGVYHSDLNANNVLITPTNQFFLIDFDKGKRYSSAGNWTQDNTDRLLRSLTKLQGLADTSFHFSSQDWQAFLDGYRV